MSSTYKKKQPTGKRRTRRKTSWDNVGTVGSISVDNSRYLRTLYSFDTRSIQKFTLSHGRRDTTKRLRFRRLRIYSIIGLMRWKNKCTSINIIVGQNMTTLEHEQPLNLLQEGILIKSHFLPNCLIWLQLPLCPADLTDKNQIFL